MRGLVCRGCNTREVMTEKDDPVLTGYRKWYPAAILDYYERFSLSCGWLDD